MQNETKEYFNFINSINSEHTKQSYAYCLQEFLAHGKLNLLTESHIQEDPHEIGKGIVMGAYAN